MKTRERRILVLLIEVTRLISIRASISTIDYRDYTSIIDYTSLKTTESSQFFPSQYSMPIIIEI